MENSMSRLTAIRFFRLGSFSGESNCTLAAQKQRELFVSILVNKPKAINNRTANFDVQGYCFVAQVRERFLFPMYAGVNFV